MDALTAILMIENDEGIEEEILEAWQYLLDTGLVWTLQGSYGRTAMNLIEQGLLRV